MLLLLKPLLNQIKTYYYWNNVVLEGSQFYPEELNVHLLSYYFLIITGIKYCWCNSVILAFMEIIL